MERPSVSLPNLNPPPQSNDNNQGKGNQGKSNQNQGKRKRKKEQLPRTPKQETTESKRDQFERVNYLHQLSLLYGESQPSLSRFYVSEMCTVSKRTVSRLGSSIKERYCRNCLRISVVAGKTRIKKGKRGSYLLKSCRQCRFVKRFLLKKKRGHF